MLAYSIILPALQLLWAAQSFHVFQTRSLHNVHNILVVNLMMANMVVFAFQNINMAISYLIGIQN